MRKLQIITATRADSDAFVRTCKLGKSMPRLLSDARITIRTAIRNAEGLSAVYNQLIQKADEDDVLLFVHDDVFIDDFNLVHRIDEALQAFDVVGVAGNVDPGPDHVSWIFWRDAENSLKRFGDRLLSGAVAHFTPNGELVSIYGPAPKQCLLLDGCFLAVSVRTLRQHEISFDERFQFHFYDLDFCNACVLKGLRLGTWPIAITHQSAGGFGSPEWEAALKVYRDKWPTPATAPILANRNSSNAK